MTGFKPRRGKRDYIKPRGNSFFFRRTIPSDFQEFFGKTEWTEKLFGRTEAERRAEALAWADKHNKAMALDIESVAQAMPNPIDGTLSFRVDLSPEMLPANRRVPPFEFYRDGKVVRTYKIAASTDPDFIEKARVDGYFSTSFKEMSKQGVFGRARLGIKRAETNEGKELAQLKTKMVARELDELAKHDGHTLNSILPKMHETTQPRESTREGHRRLVREFNQLHGSMALTAITRSHVAAYVEHLATKTIKGKPMAV